MKDGKSSNIKRTLTTKKFNAYIVFNRKLYLTEICNANGNELDPKLIILNINKLKLSTYIANSAQTYRDILERMNKHSEITIL